MKKWDDPYEGDRPWDWNECGIPPQDYDIPGYVDFILHIMQREEWGAQKTKERYLLKHPIKLFVEHFTYTEPCNSVKECMMLVNAMQKKDISDGSTDIKYNFLIGGDGNIYEGRGFHVCASKKLQQFPELYRRKLDIAYIGDYSEKSVPLKMLLKFYDIVEYAKWTSMSKININYISVRKESNFDYILQGDTPTADDGKAKLETWRRKKHLPKDDAIVDKPVVKTKKPKKRSKKKEIKITDMKSLNKETKKKREIDYKAILDSEISHVMRKRFVEIVNFAYKNRMIKNRLKYHYLQSRREHYTKYDIRKWYKEVKLAPLLGTSKK